MPRAAKPQKEYKMPAPKEAAPAAESPSKQKTFTNWSAFAKARLAPVFVKCDHYSKGFPQQDSSCHSHLPFKANDVKRHVEADHGGTFQIQVKTTDKDHPFWADLEAAGLEAHDFRCDNCDAQLRFNGASFLQHLKSHAGKTRRVKPGGLFNLTLSTSKERPDFDSNDQDEDNV